MIPKTLVCVGFFSENLNEAVTTDKMFFSSQVLSADGSDSGFSEAETAQRKLMLCHSRAILCDSSKLGKSFLFNVCRVTYVNRIISDAEVDAWLEKHREAKS